MELATEGGRRKAVARKDSDGIEKTINLTDLPSKIKMLEKKLVTANEAATDYKDAVKAVAEKCGLQASVINKGVKAIVADKVAEKKRDAEQLAMVFEEVGE